jgi:cytochrome c oxidase subunit II
MGSRRGSELAGLAGKALGVLLPMLAWVPNALADNVEQPLPWQMGFEPAASPVREHIDALHNELLVIITVITIFVMGLLLYVIIHFNAKKHPVASKVTHHPLLEVVWTVVPVLILVTIAVPSFKLMYYMDHVQKADMTLKVTGHQWYWSYEYPDQGNLTFDSNVLSDADDAKAGEPRLLGVDNPVVLPVGAVVRVLVTGTDVLHSWFMPSMGVQEYAVIGRINESWLQVLRPGTYFGQCNQICGVNHPFMPIEIKAVSKDDFDKWLADAKKKFAHNDDSGLRLAASAAH